MQAMLLMIFQVTYLTPFISNNSLFHNIDNDKYQTCITVYTPWHNATLRAGILLCHSLVIVSYCNRKVALPHNSMFSALKVGIFVIYLYKHLSENTHISIVSQNNFITTIWYQLYSTGGPRNDTNCTQSWFSTRNLSKLSHDMDQIQFGSMLINVIHDHWVH